MTRTEQLLNEMLTIIDNITLIINKDITLCHPDCYICEQEQKDINGYVENYIG